MNGVNDMYIAYQLLYALAPIIKNQDFLRSW